MVGVTAVVAYDVIIHQGVGRNAPPEFFGEHRTEIAEVFIGERNLPGDVGAAAQVQRRGYEGLVHGKGKVAVAVNASFVAHSFGDGLSEADPDVFDSVMRVDVEVTVRFYSQIEDAMFREES